MSTTTMAVHAASLQLLSRLAEETGQSADVVLDQALVEYQRRRAAPSPPTSEPPATLEAELLDDTGPIRLPPRDATAVKANVVAGGRPALRTAAEED